MEKVTISLFKKRENRRLIGLNIYGDNGQEEIREVIDIVYNSLLKNFPDVQITKYGKAKNIILD